MIRTKSVLTKVAGVTIKPCPSISSVRRWIIHFFVILDTKKKDIDFSLIDGMHRASPLIVKVSDLIWSKCHDHRDSTQLIVKESVLESIRRSKVETLLEHVFDFIINVDMRRWKRRWWWMSPRVGIVVVVIIVVPTVIVRPTGWNRGS